MMESPIVTMRASEATVGVCVGEADGADDAGCGALLGRCEGAAEHPATMSATVPTRAQEAARSEWRRRTITEPR
jgi:hypothetical protein